MEVASIGSMMAVMDVLVCFRREEHWWEIDAVMVA